MKVFYQLVAMLVLFGLTDVGLVQAETVDDSNAINIQANYPLVDDAVNLPHESTELDIHVDIQNAKAIRYYLETTESENRELVKEDLTPANGSDYVMTFNSADGFTRELTIEAVTDKDIIASKGITVNKSINTY